MAASYRCRERRFLRIALGVALALPWLPLAAAEAPAVDAPVRVTYSQAEGSPWRLDLDSAGRTVVAALGDGTEITLEIDYDSSADDGRHPGITPVVRGNRMEGLFWGDVAPLIYPILEPGKHEVERLEIVAGRPDLRIRFEGGEYRVLHPAGGGEPLYMEAVFARVEGGLRVDMNGLYYLLPSQDGTNLEITDAWKKNSLSIEMDGAGQVDGSAEVNGGQVRSRVREGTNRVVEVSQSDGHFLKYFEGVTAVEIEDGRFGTLRLTTWVERLQVQVDRNDSVDSHLLELDFDHTFKDRGQREVLTRMLLVIPPAQDRGDEDVE